MRKLTEVVLFLILAACIFAWAAVYLGLAISSGSPHFAESGWSQAKIENYTHAVHILTLWFYILPVLFFSDIMG